LGPFRPSPSVLVALLRSMARPGEHSFERLMGRVMHDPDRVRADTGDRWKAFTQYAASRAVLPSVKQAMRQLPKSGTRPIPDQDLRRIKAPTTLLWGRHDQLVPVRIGEAASNRHGWPLQSSTTSATCPMSSGQAPSPTHSQKRRSDPTAIRKEFTPRSPRRRIHHLPSRPPRSEPDKQRGHWLDQLEQQGRLTVMGSVLAGEQRPVAEQRVPTRPAVVLVLP
ncbi:MAG: hypothetical protein M3O70_26435, partial [Actinomycetota bacterium]|nr:hypothetical protein [Actinomycetota bacterium]